jgi:hypothetical protein
MPVDKDDIESLKKHIQYCDVKGEDQLKESYFQSEKERVELDDYKRFLKLRDTWSKAIIYWISFLLLSHVTIVVFVGRKYLDFAQQTTLANGLLIENFFEIVGMGLVVVKFLYPTRK